MSRKCELTPTELYFCAGLMNAKYLDYAYIQAMPDIQKQYTLHKQEALEKLEEKGLIEMDFDGRVIVDQEFEKLLRPVFFGEKESRLDMVGHPSIRFHMNDGEIIMSVMKGGLIELTEITDYEIYELLEEDQVEIHLSDIHVGKKSGIFTSEDMKDEADKKMAVKLLKGEE